MIDYQKDLAKTYTLAGQGRLDEFAGYLADDIVWTESVGFPYAGTYIGPQAVIDNVHKRLGTEWIDYKAEPDTYTFNGNQVMVYGHYSGTYKKTGNYFKTAFVHFYTFNKEGKVSHFEQIVDSVPVRQAMSK